MSGDEAERQDDADEFGTVGDFVARLPVGVPANVYAGGEWWAVRRYDWTRDES